jgi:HD superfamily phosphohydrolase
MVKKRIFNDPVYGLISFKHESVYRIIDHPAFQRLRRISQQALSHYVYSGALHTRFQHALGAVHLMTRALDTLTSKGVLISDEEYEAACIAILLHDAGHGPFSHALELVLVNVHHEAMSYSIMQQIARDLNLDLQLAMQIFSGQYRRPFFHQLVAGQLDIDRMDYLNRDSYYSGVAEGVIGYDRIIKMLDVSDDRLVVEEKGIYSIEMYLMARKTMYQQVYLHKTVVAAEFMLISILRRMKYLAGKGEILKVSEPLKYFLELPVSGSQMVQDGELLDKYLQLDDIDILHAIKASASHPDRILSRLCADLMHRRLFKVSTGSEEAVKKKVSSLKEGLMKKENLTEEESSYFAGLKKEHLPIYKSGKEEIMMKMKNGTLKKLSKLLPEYKDREVVKYYAVGMKY